MRTAPQTVRDVAFRTSEDEIAWWRRLMETEVELSKTREERIAAVRGYVDRLAKRHEQMPALSEAGRVPPGTDMELVEYSLLEAKKLLIEVRAEEE